MSIGYKYNIKTSQNQKVARIKGGLTSINNLQIYDHEDMLVASVHMRGVL